MSGTWELPLYTSYCMQSSLGNLLINRNMTCSCLQFLPYFPFFISSFEFHIIFLFQLNHSVYDTTISTYVLLSRLLSVHFLGAVKFAGSPQLSFSTCSWRERLGISGAGFCGLDAVIVTQLTVSEYWMKSGKTHFPHFHHHISKEGTMLLPVGQWHSSRSNWRMVKL